MNCGATVQDPLAQISAEQKGEFLAAGNTPQRKPARDARAPPPGVSVVPTAELLPFDYQITDLNAPPPRTCWRDTVELLAMAKATLG